MLRLLYREIYRAIYSDVLYLAAVVRDGPPVMVAGPDPPTIVSLPVPPLSCNRSVIGVTPPP